MKSLAIQTVILLGLLACDSGLVRAQQPGGAKLSIDKRNALVVVEGDAGNGTGFLATIKGAPFVVTNIHVIAGSKTIRARTIDGLTLTFGGAFVAKDADLAIIKVLNQEPLSYFEIEDRPNLSHAEGDDIIIPGNSQGGGTILYASGKISGIGPDKIEHSAPTFPGNSGSPIISVKTWKVLGVHTLSQQVVGRTAGELDSLRNKKSQIRNVRRFGYRVDTVSTWETVDWTRFSEQNKRVEEAQATIEAITSVLSGDMGWKTHPTVVNIMKPLLEVAKPNASAMGIQLEEERATRSLSNMLKRIETDAETCRSTYYGYFVREMQPLAMEAKGIREALATFKIR